MTGLSDAERRKLESQLLEQLRQDCDESQRIGYPPKGFRSMMANFGPLEACRKVIVSTPPPDGFIRLLELERAGYDALKLTAEAAVLRGPWRVLFEEPIRELARKRLVEYGRRDLAAP